MGLSSKQVTGDQGLEWGQSFSGTAEMSKPPPTRRLQEQLKCPRCASTNTKFCYYNNYNKSQPRHFCKSCKRHWTKGGILRNVPVGGGRKNKRPKTPTVAVAATPPQLDSPNFLFTDVIEEKNTSNILYQAMIQSSSPISHETKSFNNGPPTSTGLNSSEPQNINTEFQFSNLITFEENSSWANPTSYHQSLNAYDHFTGNIDSIDESIITSINNASTSYDPWVDPDTSSAYWNWNEIDVSGDLNIAWDDDDDNDNDNNEEIKP